MRVFELRRIVRWKVRDRGKIKNSDSGRTSPFAVSLAHWTDSGSLALRRFLAAIELEVLPQLGGPAVGLEPEESMNVLTKAAISSAAVSKAK